MSADNCQQWTVALLERQDWVFATYLAEKRQPASAVAAQYPLVGFDDRLGDRSVHTGESDPG